MAKHAVKYKTIVGTLSDEIMAGRYRQPMSFPSVARIVRRFGVARSFVEQRVSGAGIRVPEDMSATKRRTEPPQNAERNSHKTPNG